MLSLLKRSWLAKIGALILVAGAGMAGLGLAGDAAIPQQANLKSTQGTLKDVRLPSNPADSSAKHGFVVTDTAGKDTTFELSSRLFSKVDPKILIGKPIKVGATDNGKVFSVEAAGAALLPYNSMVGIEKAENGMITNVGYGVAGVGLLLTLFGAILSRRKE